MKNWHIKLLLAVITTAFALPISLLNAQEEKKSVEELFEEAVGFLQEDEFDKALDVLRNARKLYPKELRTSFALVQILQQAGINVSEENRKSASKYYYEAAKVADGLLGNSEVPEQAIPLLAGAIYNRAGSLAIDGKKKEAVKALRHAFESGFDDVDTAKNDNDFKSIKEDEEFKKALLAGAEIVKRRKAEALAKKIKLIKEEIAKFKSFDFDFELSNTRGEFVRLSDFNGKLLIVDFWGTWCGPCVAEIPHFVKLKKEYGEKGLEIVGIAYERTDDADEASETVNRFFEEKGVNYQSLIGDDETSKMAEVDGFPTTLFLDKEGTVRFKAVGYHEYEVLEAICKEIMKDPMDK